MYPYVLSSFSPNGERNTSPAHFSLLVSALSATKALLTKSKTLCSETANLGVSHHPTPKNTICQGLRNRLTSKSTGTDKVSREDIREQLDCYAKQPIEPLSLVSTQNQFVVRQKRLATKPSIAEASSSVNPCSSCNRNCGKVFNPKLNHLLAESLQTTTKTA